MSKLKFTLEELESASESDGGFCLACGEEAFGIEPDACNYTCESCGKPEVFGAEEIVIQFPDLII